MFYIRNPKVYEWTIGFIYGENKIYRSNNMPGTAPSFSQQFDVSTTILGVKINLETSIGNIINSG